MALRNGVIYLQKEKFQYYSPYDGKIFEFRFVPEILRDLDVINGELLENLVKAFITNTKIAPANLIFVLAENTYFTKDFVAHAAQKDGSHLEVTSEILKKQADEFIEHVPFDNVVSKTIPIRDGIKICATNKDFYETVAIAFEHMGFGVESVIPGLILGNGMSLRPVMDQPMANLILQKLNAVKQYNLLNQQVFQPQLKLETEDVDEVELENLKNKKPNKKRLYVLVGVFTSLIIVLVIVYVQSQTPPTSPKQPALASTTNTSSHTGNPVILATPEPTTIQIVQLSSTEAQNLTVQVINASSSANTAQELLGDLDTLKFKKVDLQTASEIESSGSLVSFAPSVGQDVRNAVLTEVKKYTSNLIVQEKQIGTYDVSIVLAQ